MNHIVRPPPTKLRPAPPKPQGRPAPIHIIIKARAFTVIELLGILAIMTIILIILLALLGRHGG